MITLTVNGQPRSLDVSADMPLLWVLRDHLQLTGSKFGCGMALCGACTVHLNGQPIRACVTPVAAAASKEVTTIEGLSGPAIEALRAAWADLEVTQCGYCQSGQLMSAAALLARNPQPSDSDIDAAMNGNLCRCATYQRIRAGIQAAAKQLGGQS